MTSASFEVDTSAMSTGASGFGSQSEPILEQSRRLDALKGSSSTTGRDYAAQGTAYHDAMTKQLGALIDDFALACNTVQTNLDANAKTYESRDADNTSAMKTSASGMN